MTSTERIAMILKALNYTPKTLAAATGMSEYVAKGILNAKGAMRTRDMIALINLTGMTANDLFMGRVNAKDNSSLSC